MPAASKRAPRSRENPRPAAGRPRDAARPRISASTATPASTWPRVAPTARSSANSRRRWATVMENVLKMMKAPTSRAAPEKASSAGLRNAPMLSLICFDESAVAWAPVLTSRLRGRTARSDRTSLLGCHARRCRHDDARDLALEAVPRLHVGERRDDHRGAAHRGDVAEVDDPHEARPVDPGPARHADARADREVVVRRELAVDDDLAAGRRKAPGDVFIGLNGAPTMARTIAGANCGCTALPSTTSAPGW